MDISFLKKYANQQVVINFYDDEELVKRDGIFFNRIEVTKHHLKFIREEQCELSLSIINYPTFQVNDNFKNYYTLLNESSYIDIYFP